MTLTGQGLVRLDNQFFHANRPIWAGKRRKLKKYADLHINTQFLNQYALITHNVFFCAKMHFNMKKCVRMCKYILIDAGVD